MHIIVFTKLLKPWNAERLIQFAKENGLGGFDLCIRPGYPVTLEKMEAELPAFAEKVSAAGLAIPMATVGMSALPPREKATEAAWAACAAAGIRKIKLGYWTWKPGGGAEHYWTKVAEIRKELSAYARLGEKHGVQALFHTHSDPYYGLNASALMHLLHDQDPAHVAAYLDPAHLGLDGEPLAMALDILRGRIGMLAVKNSHYRKVETDGRIEWKRGDCRLHEGLVNWPEAVKLLRAAGYAGALSVHGEYDERHELEPVLEYLVPDLAYLQECLGISSQP